MSFLLPDEEGVFPLKNRPLGRIWDKGGNASEEVRKRAQCASSTLLGPERDVSGLLVDERMIGLSRLSPQGPIEEVIISVEGCPSMGEERDMTDGVGVRALVNMGLVVSTVCIASTRDACGIG